jgi:prepilin-type N-terminal cleavage/methylation domain-containing protein
MTNRPTLRNIRQGVTLFEMLIVVSIIALCASIAIPNASTVTPFRADTVAGEIARALRFAQREAIRTSAWYQVKFDTTAQTVRVYRLTIASSATEDISHPTVNPIDKQPYALNFRAGPAIGAISAVSFDYGKNGTHALSFHSILLGPLVTFREMAKKILILS